MSSANAGSLPHKVNHSVRSKSLCVGVLFAIAASFVLGYAWYCKRHSRCSRISKEPSAKTLPWSSGHRHPAWSLCNSSSSVSPSKGSADVLHWQPSQSASKAQLIDSSNKQSLQKTTWGSTRQSEDTAFFTSPIVTDTHASCLAEWQAAQSQQKIYSIPAPLWSEVEILPDNIDIAQTSTGKDWILGEGSFGTVWSGQKSKFMTNSIQGSQKCQSCALLQSGDALHWNNVTRVLPAFDSIGAPAGSSWCATVGNFALKSFS